MLKESHFTPKQLELFEQRYENGYDLYTDIDYVAWLMENHLEDVPDEILSEMGSNFDHGRSDPFQPFEKVPKSPKSGDFTITLEPSTEDTNEQHLCESVALLPSKEPGVNLLKLRLALTTLSHHQSSLNLLRLLQKHLWILSSPIPHPPLLNNH